MKSDSLMAVRFIVVVAVILTTLIPCQASAQKFYGTVKAGIYSPKTSDHGDFDTGLNGEVALGWRFHRNFAAEMSFGEFIIEAEDHFSGPVGITGEEEADISVTPLTFTLKAIIPYKRWEFFGLGGVGAYLVYKDFRTRVAVGAPPFLVADLEDDDYDTVFGTHLGLGFHYSITPNIFAGAEGKYLWTNKVKMEENSFGISSLSEFKLNGIVVTAVIGFTF